MKSSGGLRRAVAGLRELGIGRVRPQLAELISLVRPTSRCRALVRHRIGQLVPMVATPGDTGVTFAALSYAGKLTISVIADPGIVPEYDALAAAVRRTLTVLARKHEMRAR
uniref:WS/DGAT domain-containing protein n=1 Tax=Paractinoplanes polyasparticus TaxID=2856853 RepID=UPI001C847140|nr:WS/DGAT domain-containing protein [Actinoplanes polyasparticus]